MKAYLMHHDRDLELDREPPPCESDAERDLGLATLYEAMAGRDEFLLNVVRSALRASLATPDAIRYRQDILRDCLAHQQLVTELYDLSVDPISRDKKVYRGPVNYAPDYLMHRAIPALRQLLTRLRTLRDIADKIASAFRSPGFSRFFTMLRAELTDEYFIEVEEHLRHLEFRDGILVAAHLGAGNRATDLTLLRPPAPRLIPRVRNRTMLSIKISPRDEAGVFALTDMRQRGLDLAADVLVRSTEHILNFFDTLRAELGFYMCCLRLHERLARKGEPVCFPTPVEAGKQALSCAGLYNVCLSLSTPDRVVGNDVTADRKLLVVVTGANQGGKSTFLRSVGLAQRMMQAGLFVPAKSYIASVCPRVFTHFRREEDVKMESGRFDEELARMSTIVDQMTPGCLLLCNESFAATNEREGSEVARQILRAMVEAGVRIVFVTHLFELSHGLSIKHEPSTLFLRAQRTSDGHRTFKVVDGEPLVTSHGEDLYQRIFDTAGPTDTPEAGPPRSS